MEKEVRFSTLESRADEESKKMIVEGYAIIFNEETLIGTEEHGFLEVISPDALKEANMKDVPFKYEVGGGSSS